MRYGQKMEGWNMQELGCCTGSRTEIIHRDSLKLLTRPQTQTAPHRQARVEEIEGS